MSAEAAAPGPHAFLAPVARFTRALFALAPPSFALLVLRLALARPFFASGLTRWDGRFTLSFGTKMLFTDEYRSQRSRARPRSSCRSCWPSAFSGVTRRSAFSA